MKYISIITALLLAVSCNTKKPKSESEGIPTIRTIEKNDEGLLIICTNGQHTNFKVQAESFEYKISPDSLAIIVNERIHSTLQVSNYYPLDISGKIDTSAKRNLSLEAWDTVSNKHEISKDDVIFPKTRAMFSDDQEGRITVVARGQTELGKEIKEKVQISVNSKDSNK